jgi:uncharacterized membrane protein
MDQMRTALEEAGIRISDFTDNRSRGGRQNVGVPERWVSSIAGGALALFGLTRRTPAGVGLALAGAALLYRGVTGHSYLYEAMGISNPENVNPNVSVRANAGFKVEKSITINSSPDELYRFWRNFQNLPRIMNHLESVRDIGGNRSHWVAKAPAGTTVEWDAEIYNEKENELIAWRSLENADVDNAGSVHFEPAPGGRGTVVRVSLKYDPPGGFLGATVARLFGENPEQQIEEDLRRFKQVMETGEVTTTEDQPFGRTASTGR